MHVCIFIFVITNMNWIRRSLLDIGLVYNDFDFTNWYNVGYLKFFSFLNYEERNESIYTYDIPRDDKNE